MDNENKVAELKDQQLEKANGGTTDYFLWQACPNCHVGHLLRYYWSGGSYLKCVDDLNGGCGFKVEG